MKKNIGTLISITNLCKLLKLERNKKCCYFSLKKKLIFYNDSFAKQNTFLEIVRIIQYCMKHGQIVFLLMNIKNI